MSKVATDILVVSTVMMMYSIWCSSPFIHSSGHLETSRNVRPSSGVPSKIWTESQPSRACKHPFQSIQIHNFNNSIKITQNDANRQVFEHVSACVQCSRMLSMSLSNYMVRIPFIPLQKPKIWPIFSNFDSPIQQWCPNHDVRMFWVYLNLFKRCSAVPIRPSTNNQPRDQDLRLQRLCISRKCQYHPCLNRSWFPIFQLIPTCRNETMMILDACRHSRHAIFYLSMTLWMEFALHRLEFGRLQCRFALGCFNWALFQ